MANECDADGNCPVCGTDFTECDCPGITQDDEFDYQFDAKGTLWAKRKRDVAS
jgi:hypothetical protein